MRLFVVIALAVLALAESASLKKKSAGLPGKLIAELDKLEAAKAKEEAALAKKADKREEEDDFGLPDMDIAFNGDGGAFLGVVLTPEDAVCVVSAAEEYGGWIAEGINIYHMAGFFFKERDDWMMGYLMTTDEAIAGVSCLYGADPPPCSYDGTGCDISSYIDTLKGDADLAISGYGMGMTDAIPMVAGNIDENGVIDEDGVHDAAAAQGEVHSGYLVPYAEAVGGVAEALGVDSPILEKKEVAKKKSTEVAELLQKLRETVRNLKQK